MKANEVEVQRRGAVAVARLNRPDRMNALSVGLMEEITAVARAFALEADLRAIVFTGEGKHFSVGADLADPAREERQRAPLALKRRLLRVGPEMIRALREIPQITISAVHGMALGGAAVIASALDFRLGTADCLIGYPEINRGMNLSWLGLPLLVSLIGPARAKRMVLLGRPESAATLAAWGFLDEVVEPERLMPRAIELAEAYAAQPPVQAQMIKASVNAIASALDAPLMHMELDQFLLAASTEDHAEAVRAFFEKRRPTFRGN